MSAEDSVSLKEYFDSEIDNIKLLIKNGFQESKDAVRAALDSQKEAVLKSEAASEKRFSSVNEFRNTLADQQRNLMPRNEVDILIKAINEKIDALNLKTITEQSKDVGKMEGMGIIAIVAGIVSTIVVILSRFIK